MGKKENVDYKVIKVFQELEGQTEEPSTLILLTQIMQLEEVLAKLIPISHILVCMSISMLQIVIIQRFINGQSGKVKMVRKVYREQKEQMVKHRIFIELGLTLLMVVMVLVQQIAQISAF